MKQISGTGWSKIGSKSAVIAGSIFGLLLSAQSTEITFYANNNPEQLRFDESKNPYSYNLREILAFRTHNASESTRIRGLVASDLSSAVSKSPLIVTKRTPWSSYWYPLSEGGMLRSNSYPSNQYATSDISSYPDVVELSNWANAGVASERINALPAALKLDILLGNVFRFTNGKPNPKFYNVSSKQLELFQAHSGSFKNDRRGLFDSRGYRRRDWGGFGNCIGWAMAAIREPEPQTFQVRKEIVVNGKIIPLDFTLSADDVSLFYMMAYTTFINEENDQDGIERHVQVGWECVQTVSQRAKMLRKKSPHQMRGDEDAEACDDVNAGAFFVAVTNKIGKYGRPIFGDVQPDIGNWNHPFVGYAMNVSQETYPTNGNSAPAAHHLRKVDFDLVYRDWSAPGTANQSSQFLVKNYEFYLELDANETVIGGDWISLDRPDYVADVRKMAYSKHPVKILKYIMSQSAQAPNARVVIPADLRPISRWSVPQDL